MKKIYILLVLLVMIAVQRTTAQAVIRKPATTYESNWQLNAGIGYGTYYGDMSRYNIRNFSDIGYLRNFLNYNQNYIKEPSFHLSVVKRLGLTATGIGLNLSRTLIQGSDRYVTSNGNLQTNDPNFSRSLNFKTDILDAGISLNLNAFSKGFFSPYLTFGTGFSFFDVRGDLFTGQNQDQPYSYTSQQNVNDGIFETKLRDQQTETDVKYPNTVFYAQGVLGFNFRLSNNFSLAVESDVKYSGSDYLDDLSGRYKTAYPTARSQYIAKPGYNNSNPQTGSRGRNDNVNDIYIQNRIVFRIHIPKYLKRSEVKTANTKFNAPVLYPNNYDLPLDSSVYAKSLWNINNRSARADSIRQRRMQDSLMMRRMDSARTDSLRRTAVTNVKMDSAFTNEVKSLRQEIAGLRQTIDKANQQSRKDSMAVQRTTLRDSLNQNLQKLNQKKRKTATDSLQQQIYQLRLDSIALAEKYAVTTDTVVTANPVIAQSTTTKPATTITTSGNNNREDSLRRVIDSLRRVNTGSRTTTQPVTQPQPVNSVRTIRDTLAPAQVQQYQQQVAGLAYRSRQKDVNRSQLQNKTDSINSINAGIRASDSLKIAYYQSRLAQTQQQEAEIKKTERRGLLVKKSDTLKTAEANRADAEARLQVAQTARQQNEQNSRVATGDTVYISNLQAQQNRRQAEIDSLKKSKKVTDIFSDKNKRIKELEQQQKDQQQQIDDANRMLQYYRTTGPTSYYQPTDNDRRQIDNLNGRINDLQNQRYTNYQNPPVNVVSPVVVSGNDDEKRRMQREIDSLRNQVAVLQQTRRDTAGQPSVNSVMLDSTMGRPVIASRTAASQMADLQRQLAELNNRLNAVSTPATVKQPQATNDTSLHQPSATVYFNRGSVLLTTLQKAKLAALVKKSKKADRYQLTANSDNTTGNKTVNEALARKRAVAVAAYLKTKGIAASAISSMVNSVVAKPGSKPDPLARRVDVVIE